MISPGLSRRSEPWVHPKAIPRDRGSNLGLSGVSMANYTIAVQQKRRRTGPGWRIL